MMSAQHTRTSAFLWVQEAAQDLVEAHRLDPGNEMIEEVRAMMIRFQREGRKSNKETYYKMFSKPTASQ
jgi:hypothetical protein